MRGAPCKRCGQGLRQAKGPICTKCGKTEDAEIITEGFKKGLDYYTIAELFNSARAKRAGPSGYHMTINPGGVIVKFQQLGLIAPEEAEARFKAFDKEKAARRAKERAPKWLKTRDSVLERDGRICKVCGRQDELEVHHIIPFVEVKKHEPHNLVTLCEECHDSFGRDRIWLDFDKRDQLITPLTKDFGRFAKVISTLGWRLITIAVVDHCRSRAALMIRPALIGDGRRFYVCARHFHFIAPDKAKDDPHGAIEFQTRSERLCLISEHADGGGTRISIEVAQNESRDLEPLSPRTRIGYRFIGKHSVPITTTQKVPRNAPCPCGSKKKFKHCCGLTSSS